MKSPLTLPNEQLKISIAQLRSKGWFTSHPHLIQWPDPTRSQKDPEDDSGLQVEAPDVVTLPDVVSLTNMT